MTTIEIIAQEHFELVANWLSRHEINRWLTSEWRVQTATPLLIAMGVRNKKNQLFLVRCNGQLCGMTALSEVDTIDSTAMVWYFLGDQALSGQGIMSEAVRQIVFFSFKELGLKSVYAWAMEDNKASIRVLKKTGFREVGRIRQAASSCGRQVDRLYFDLVASEYIPDH